MRPIRLNRTEEAIQRSRDLRKQMSVSEKWFWRSVRKDLLGFRFRRQYPIGPYFLDFYVPAAKLCIEIDGEQHLERLELDKKRDSFLAQFGILTVRIPSVEIFHQDQRRYAAWIEEIQNLCEARTASPPPTPSSRKQEEGASEEPPVWS